jgi:hypothetical protein
MPAKRGDRVAPPARPDGWEARFATSEAAKGWEELCRAAQANTWEAWVVLTERPTQPENPSRQHRLRGQLAERQIGGRTLPQWQYEVTAGGRIWYCPERVSRPVSPCGSAQLEPDFVDCGVELGRLVELPRCGDTCEQCRWMNSMTVRTAPGGSAPGNALLCGGRSARCWGSVSAGGA